VIEMLDRYRLSTIWMLACCWVAWYLELTQGRIRP